MQRNSLVFVAGCMLVVACGSEDTTGQTLPYMSNLTTVIGASGAGQARVQIFSTPDDDACVDEDDDHCLTPQEKCGSDGTADLLVDDKGDALAVICYPHGGGVVVDDIDGEIDHVGNNVVLVLDALADGADIAGDVVIDGNNVTLYGHGPAVSVIGGDLHIDKNNALVRGLRVRGDVVIEKNNPSIVDCVIEGDLTIRGNNVAIAMCDVWGHVYVEGNNTVLVENRFAFGPAIAGNNTVCNRDYAFVDADGDGVIADLELGGLLQCAGKGK